MDKTKKSKVVISENNLSERDIVVSNDKQHICDICQEEFTLESIHERCKDYDLKVFKNYLCDTCGKKFASKQSLVLHMTTVHEGRKDYICSICEKKFGRKSDLLTHIKTVHESGPRGSQRLRMRRV
ncbi:zinc finger protein 322-like [Trichogramma pretiosum]|uniref:zinc finger protein 322-like n=1 Tax=Trichogramma pretiosum TaxID=7493 RepID=UPI0006C9E1AD|nr:zinc finger protein 322-like [Trichogramma pretiosum]